MWPGFDSRTRRHMWVEFVVGSRPCSEGFSPGTLVFYPPQKPTFPNSNSMWKQRTNSHSVDVQLKFPFIYYLFIYHRHSTSWNFPGIVVPFFSGCPTGRYHVMESNQKVRFSILFHCFSLWRAFMVGNNRRARELGLESLSICQSRPILY